MSKDKKAFTIIEVVLVLAIAGLIFLMVFIALPALQRSQRNTQRKNDLSRFVTAVTQYQANNSNKLPFSGSAVYLDKDNSDFVKRYIVAGGDASQFQDPNGEDYKFSLAWSGNVTLNCQGVEGANSARIESGKHCASDLIKGVNQGESKLFEKYGREVVVYTKAKCNPDEGFLDQSSGKNDFALMMVLEGNSIACNDNQ